MASLTLTLLVDMEKNRVVLAEADKNFVDILFSFLTLPLGTVVRLLGKQSMVGCVDKLYQSVEKMDAEYLQMMACKTMLLQPRSEAEQQCEDLKINVDDLRPRRFYRCPTFECFARNNRLFSSVYAARCKCGKAMDMEFQWTKRENTDIGNGDGIFVKGCTRFIISDDLHVMPAFSIEATLSFLQKHGIRDTGGLEKKTVNVARDKILKLLNRLLVSTTPLTDIFVRKLDTMECGTEHQDCQLRDTKQIKSEDDSTATSTLIRVNILYDKLSKKLVYAQAGEDLVDALFSFLTFPLGCIVKLLEGFSSVGCLHNLYKSVELFDGSFGIKSEECKNLLLAPKLATHFGCSNQLLRTEEKTPQKCDVQYCLTCRTTNIIGTPANWCSHSVFSANRYVEVLTQVNPKLFSCGTKSGGGYAKKSFRFMITDDMGITPLLPISGIDAIKQLRTPIHCLVEKEVVLGEVEIANLLKACLISRTVLTNVVCSEKSKKVFY